MTRKTDEIDALEKQIAERLVDQVRDDLERAAGKEPEPTTDPEGEFNWDVAELSATGVEGAPPRPVFGRFERLQRRSVGRVRSGPRPSPGPLTGSPGPQGEFQPCTKTHQRRPTLRIALRLS